MNRMQNHITTLLRFLILIICLVNYVSCSSQGKVPPKAIKGVLDLREWSFDPLENSEVGNIKLDGEWEFYWSTFPGNDFSLPEEEKEYTKVPMQWDGYKKVSITNNKEIREEILEGEGFATYRLKVITDKVDQLSFRLPYQGTAYALYANNQIIFRGGNPGTSVEDSKPTLSTDYINFTPIEKEFYLIICISNFHHARGGFWSSITMGNPQSISRLKESYLTIDIFISGVLFIMGIYHFSLFYLRRDDKSNLYFGLFCTIIFLRTIIIGERYIFTHFPNLSYSSRLTLDYLTMNLVLPFPIAFFFSLYPYWKNNKILNIINVVTIVLVGINIFLPPSIFTKTLVISHTILLSVTLYLITLIFLEYKRDREGIKIFLLGSIIFTVIVINDILHSKNIIVTGNLIPLGLVIFIFFQSFNLSSRFSKAFEDVKTLSSTLKQSYQELELNKERITKAYLDLEASQKQLVQSDKMITLGTMVAGVAHEINTPLGAIKANSENILESLRGLIQKLNPSLSHITIGDLHNAILVLELTKEAGTAYSSREARTIRKKVISTLEEREQKNVDVLADYIIDLGLVEALERSENILNHIDIEKYLSIAADLYGIRKKSSVIQTSAERVSKIVKSLKSFMHFDQNEKKVVSDLTEGMETVLIILHNKIKYGIEVIKNYGENVVQISCYPDELNQVWTNLIHNAIQAMDEKGTLQIDIEKITNLEGTPDIDKRNPDYKGEYVAVSIQDSGSGISPEIRTKIFQAFFTTKPAGEGSGLGLHIIGKILEKHEGALYLESEPGKTRFTVVLPV